MQLLTSKKLVLVKCIFFLFFSFNFSTVIKQNLAETGIATLVIRGSTQNILNDIERAVEDGVNVVRGMTRDHRFLAGAGAAEIEIGRQIQSFAEQSSGLEQVYI